MIDVQKIAEQLMADFNDGANGDLLACRRFDEQWDRLSAELQRHLRSAWQNAYDCHLGRSYGGMVRQVESHEFWTPGSYE